MLSFGNKKYNLSGLHSHRLPHLNSTSKESIFRPLLYRGSLSVEAALVLPLFLFFLMTLLSMLQLMNFSEKLQQLLYQEGIYLSEISFDKGNASVSRVADDIRAGFGTGKYPVEGGLLGLDFENSRLDDPELTEIVVTYSARLTITHYNKPRFL